MRSFLLFILLFSLSSFANIVPDRDANGNIVNVQSAFNSKAVKNGALFKRVHGISQSVGSMATVNIDFVIPYNVIKFTGAEIFNVDEGDHLNFTVHDTPTNTLSGLDVGTYGANVLLNQFGSNVYMPNDKYRNTSNYDAEMIKDMIIRATYTNSTVSPKTIYINFELHEVVQ